MDEVKSMKLIVGLGNPGREYEKTRHNMGFMAIDAIAQQYNVSFQKEKFGGLYTEIRIDGETYLLLKPQKYINLSGEVIKKYMDFYKIPIENLLVISDDLDMEFGRIRLKLKGSSGGHNGLKNIEMHLGTQNYHRIKIGISNRKEIDTKDYVLGKLNSEEQKKLKEVLETMPKIFEDYRHLTFENLMNQYNSNR